MVNAGDHGLIPIGKFNAPVSSNWHGSEPTIMADTAFEPNFRQFDFFLENKEVPNSNLSERVFKPGEGETHYDLRNFLNSNIRCTPVLVTSLFGAAFCNHIYTRLMNRTGVAIRWTFFVFYGMMLTWNNFTKYYARERYCLRDFQRNQLYSFDELRDQRDRQRVREALYEQQFVSNPIAEYRVKSWQVANRFG